MDIEKIGYISCYRIYLKTDYLSPFINEVDKES